MKLIGLLMIVLIGAMLGVKKSAGFSNRAKQLECCISMINTMSTEIRYQSTPLNEIIDVLSRREEYKPLWFLPGCTKLCHEKMSFPKAWQASIHEQSKDCSLKKDDCDILIAFGNSLGTSDTDGQLANCTLHTSLLEDSLKVARKDRDGFGKLYSSLGLLLGIGVAILLY